MDADYVDDIELLADTPTHAGSPLYTLEKAAGGIGVYVNADKTEYMCFNQNQKGGICTLKAGSLKLVDKFHLPRRQRPINRKRRQYASSKGMDCYR